MIYRTDSNMATTFRNLADEARKSPDPSTQNAACLLDNSQLGFAYRHNRPIHEDYIPLLGDRDLKLGVTVHAEEAAVKAVSKLWAWPEMAALWASCPDCARDIVGARIRRLYTLPESAFPGGFPERWKKSVDLGLDILTKCGVTIVYVTFTEPIGVSWRWNGQQVAI